MSEWVRVYVSGALTPALVGMALLDTCCCSHSRQKVAWTLRWVHACMHLQSMHAHTYAHMYIHPCMLVHMQAALEKRVDPSDGCSYTRQEFDDYYRHEGAARWVCSSWSEAIGQKRAHVANA